ITSRFVGKLISSLGAASGARTSSGWGSKVSTVSAPSITRRWPTCTPSKVPIATRRGRRSAAFSSVTWIVIPENSIRRFDPSERFLQRQGPLAGPLDPERADRGATQLLAVGVAQVGHEAAHVGARG